eukprot:Gregarina_sp_Poly_1__8484@NODE_4_length_26097_cov_247_784211_g3_i0_p14_GENE_NODE_4_length_26097_cov_247_784211_g3_i0NODE_4_length_26097_cov_247_784211_g3_i0_p14_ORF_typecomplete_len166_score13_62_NODE_4_length_26097_cov_247_784211_g3_i02560026025
MASHNRFPFLWRRRKLRAASGFVPPPLVGTSIKNPPYVPYWEHDDLAACDSSSTRASDVTLVTSRLFSSPADGFSSRLEDDTVTETASPVPVIRRNSLNGYPVCPLLRDLREVGRWNSKFVPGAHVRQVVERFADSPNASL